MLDNKTTKIKDKISYAYSKYVKNVCKDKKECTSRMAHQRAGAYFQVL